MRNLTVRPGRLLVIDLTLLRLCDSSGISALIAARNRTTASDAGIALVGVSAHLARIFGLIGLSGVFPTYPTIEAAHNAWAGGTHEPPLHEQGSPSSGMVGAEGIEPPTAGV
ncbi:STAS domain-containing protein [Nocardia brasiliensis]|uniref:STAS domain-containing protein n=1 Tax=Nocardia brasiliensis TaxID=37326 RepID=UPI003799AB19